MKTETLVKNLNENDFYIDEQGRVVLENSELMKQINGASGLFSPESCNSGCANAYCT